MPWWWSRSRRDDDLDRELRAHLELEAREHRARGQSPAAARHAARRAFGNLALVREDVRAAWGWTSLERLAQDLRYALRLLRKNPGFAAVAVLSLALGIGANTAIFTIVNAIVLKPLPVREPLGLLLLDKSSAAGVDPGFYYETFVRLRHEQSFFQELAAWSPVELNVTVGGESESSPGQLVSGNYYSVLGIQAALGRTLTPEDDLRPGAHPVAVISHAYWQRRFNLDPAILGRQIRIDGLPFTVVGVTPPSFFGTEVGAAPAVTVPLMMQHEVMPDKENWLSRSVNTVEWLRLFGRLRPGIPPAQAAAGMDALLRRVQTQLAAEIDPNWQATWLKSWADSRLVLRPGATGSSDLRRRFSTPLFALMAVVALVLLIACTNVAGLLLSRAAARRREIALRLAIGATRGRLVRQLLVESLLLGFLGGLLGAALAFWGSTLLVRFLAPSSAGLSLDLTPDLRVLAFTAALSLLAGSLFGLIPALQAAAIDLTPALKSGGRAATPRQRFGKTLSAAQVALSLVLVLAAALLVRSLQRLDAVDSGFARDHVFSVALAPRGSDQKNGPAALRLHRLYLDLQARVLSLPGVVAASLAGPAPTASLPRRNFTTPDGQTFRATWTQVYPGYFATLGAPILQGRDFDDADQAPGAPFVAVINQTLAQRAFSGRNPIGRRVLCNRTQACEVVGVVRDLPYATLKRDPESTLYQTFLQAPTGRGQMHLHVRFRGDTAVMAAQLRREVSALDPNLPAFTILSLAVEVDAALERERLLALLSSAFGALALLLAAIGLYGVIACSVARRTQEIGVRIALGASRREVWRLVMLESVGVAAAGIAAGIPAALFAARLLRAFLYDLGIAELPLIAASAGLLLAIALFAAFVPARRAARVDPLIALRAD